VISPALGNEEVNGTSEPEAGWMPIDLTDASFATLSKVPTVPDGKISELPFPLEHWEDFEKLVVALAIDVDGLVEVRRYGTTGQLQDGIDVIGFTRLGHHAHAYQCKNVQEFSESDLVGAIKKFTDGGRPFNPRRLVIAVATAANRTQLIRKLEDARPEQPDLILELWDATRISELLRDRPRLVEQFFGEDVARRFCVSASFPASASRLPAAVTGGIPLEMIMRGPVRTLGFDARFEEATGQEQDDPGAAASTFADIADRLSAAGYGGHADALRRRAVQAYNAAGQYQDAVWLHTRIVAEAILAGRWTDVPGMLWVLHQLLNEQASHGQTVDEGLKAVVSILGATSTLFEDPMLMPESTATAVAAAAPHLNELQAALPADPAHRTVLLLAAGAAVVTVAECALAAEAFDAITAAADSLEQSAAALRREGDETLRHLGVRLRVAITEARGPTGADDAGWEELQREATGWKLDDRDAALVLSRYARTRAWAGSFADADAAWQRAAEFATRARLFTDIAGWLSCQIRLRYRYGPTDLAEIGDMRQMIRLLSEQPSERVVPIGGVREAILDALRRGDEQLRPAALAAQRLRVLSAAGGLWDDELEAHSFLGDIYERTGDMLLAAAHRVRSGEADAAGRVATQGAGVFLDVTAELSRPAAAERSVAYTVLTAQADLIPDELVNVVAERARDDIQDAHAGKTAETPFSGRPVLVSASEAAAAVAGRLPGQIAEQLMAALDWRLTMDKDTVVWTDEPHLRMLVAIAAAEDDDEASAAFGRISQLFAIESPALRGHGRDLAAAVRRRPDEVRAILVTLAGQGSQLGAEMLAGWSLTGEPGRGIARPVAEQSAWDTAAPFAEQAAIRLAAPPKGTPGVASMIASFSADAGLVTILDSADVEKALTGLLRVAADPLHLAITRQQALTAATILVAGSTGDCLGSERLTEVFGLAREYACGEHDGSAMDDMATWSHPLGSGRINMGDTSLAVDGLCLAARASRTSEEHASVLSIAGQIVRGRPAESALNGVGHALAALPDLSGATAPVSVGALSTSPSESLRAVAALHWARRFAPADAPEDAEQLGTELAGDPAPNVRRGLAANLAIIAAGSGLSDAGKSAAGILSIDPDFGIRNAAREALTAANSPRY
jgi:hypothetical protein